MQKITPFLWFDNNVEEALEFYLTIFPDATTHSVERVLDSLTVVSFTLMGQEFKAMNAGPYFKFNEAVSFLIDCEDQDEVDYYWSRLSDGGEESQCGWLKDRFGLSWQVVPRRGIELLRDPDPDRANRVMQAIYGMKKIDIAGLERAYASS